jgi:hypothetical protein
MGLLVGGRMGTAPVLPHRGGQTGLRTRITLRDQCLGAL